MTSPISSYAFAAEEGYARRLLTRYARLFDTGPVADLGSGRGYFLDALQARGIDCIGVDASDEAAEYAAAANLPFVKDDALSYLRSAADLGGVFASHLIEHLDPQAATEMIRLAAVALGRGGRIVIVTPNLKDFRTLTETFWYDTTHVRPYPAKLVAALLESHGLVVDEIGLGVTPLGRRAIPAVLLGRLRFGRDYGSSELYVSAHKP